MVALVGGVQGNESFYASRVFLLQECLGLAIGHGEPPFDEFHEGVPGKMLDLEFGADVDVHALFEETITKLLVFHSRYHDGLVEAARSDEEVSPYGKTEAATHCGGPPGDVAEDIVIIVVLILGGNARDGRERRVDPLHGIMASSESNEEGPRPGFAHHVRVDKEEPGVC